jgi:hypothetical protein
MKSLLTFIFLSVFVSFSHAGGVLRICSEQPTEEKTCDMYSSLNYKYMDSVFVEENGKMLKKPETTLYFTLLNDEPFGNAGVVIFELYEVMDASTSEYRFIEQRRLDVQPDWNFSWVKFTFNTKGLYKVRCFVGDTWVAESSIPLWVRE